MKILNNNLFIQMKISNNNLFISFIFLGIIKNKK